MTDALTRLNLAERALLDSEVRLQQVLDNTSALVFAKDRQGRYLFVNREFERIVGRSAADILGRRDEEVFPAELATRFRHNDLRVLREGCAIEFEEIADFGEGERTFLSSKFPLCDAAREAYAVCGIATDITERKRALQSLSDSEAQYRAIFNASVDALVLFDSQLRRVDVNPAFERMYGWTRDEVLGKGYDEAAGQQGHADTRRELVRRALAGETARCELDAVRKDGEHIRIEMITIPFRHRGEPHALAIGRDITERKRLEDALSRAALAVSEAEGEALFRELARYLATILRVDAVFISTVDPADCAQMQVRAMHLDGRTIENFSYALGGTPCETVVGQEFRFYPSGLQQLFPKDTDFRDLGFEAYAGHPLTDASGRPLGLLAVVCRRPLENPSFVESVLRIFAARVLAEIQRLASQEALRTSEANYREIFEASEDAIFVHDWDTGAILDANPQACASYGYSREEFRRLRLGDLSSGESPYTEEEGLRWIEQAKSRGSVRFEWQRRSRDGSLHWDEVRLKAARIGGQPRVLAFTREITEHKAAEAALRASEEQYRAIFNASVDGLMLKDAAHRIVDVSDAYLAMHGYRREEMIGRRLSEFIPVELQARCDALLPGILGGVPCHIEALSRRRDGSTFAVDIHGVPMQYGGRPHALVIMRDITAAKRAEEALRASEQHYRAIFNASTDAMILWDSQLHRVDVNAAYERTFGWSREEVLGRGYGCEPEYAAPREAMVRRALAGEACHAELESLRKDGTHIDIEVDALPFRHRGEPHVLAVVRDITERKRAEKDRQILEGRLRQAQKLEAIGQLTGGIAHDFNNLLTSIMGYVALAADRDAVLGDRRLSGYLAQAQRSCERARDLIQQMLMFSRGQRGSPQALDLAQLVRESLETLKSTLPATIQLVSEIDDSVPLVRTDPLQVEQVLLNLCINARDAVGESGRLAVSVRFLADPEAACSGCRVGVHGPFVEMSVADTGHGMTPEVMERVFEPFFSTKETGKGTGMGLAMVHGIVHDHGGHVVVESQPGRGSRFRVLWPAISTADEQAIAPSEAPVRGDRRPRPLMRGAALIVDDEAAVGEFMRELLGTWGLEATFVSSPLAALELVAEEPGRFDVVVTDQTMPRMTGLELARAIRERRATLPVVLYTGYGRGIAPADLESAGIRAVLGKPIDPAALEDALGGILGRR